ncbi:MAG: CPBP family intramembrane metalloprotease [Tannerella sp.]|jgi:membrane protease YdiL (CAAX protease family)|nr:CPBP family intramembrane metalloprotease [Tannerella sp.]
MKGIFENRSTLYQFGLLIFIFLAGLFFASLLSMTINLIAGIPLGGGVPNDLKGFLLTHLALFMSDVFAFIIPAAVVAYLCSSRPRWFLLLNRLNNNYLWLYIILIMLFVFPLVDVAGFYNMKMHLPDFMKPVEGWMRAAEDLAAEVTKSILIRKEIISLIINIFIIAICAAVAEELFFRGAVLSLIRKKIRNPHVAIIIVAVIFSAVHFQFYGFLPRLILGVVLGYLAVWTRSIWAPVFAHFLNNFIGVISAFFSETDDVVNESVLLSDDITSTGLLKVAVIVVCSLILTVLCSKKIIKISNFTN